MIIRFYLLYHIKCALVGKSTSKRQLHFGFHQICYMKMTIVTGFQKMVVERVTHHLLQGKLLLQIEVSMPPEMLIR